MKDHFKEKDAIKEHKCEGGMEINVIQILHAIKGIGKKKSFKLWWNDRYNISEVSI